MKKTKLMFFIGTLFLMGSMQKAISADSDKKPVTESAAPRAAELGKEEQKQAAYFTDLSYALAKYHNQIQYFRNKKESESDEFLKIIKSNDNFKSLETSANFEKLDAKTTQFKNIMLLCAGVFQEYINKYHDQVAGYFCKEETALCKKFNAALESFKTRINEVTKKLNSTANSKELEGKGFDVNDLKGLIEENRKNIEDFLIMDRRLDAKLSELSVYEKKQETATKPGALGEAPANALKENIDNLMKIKKVVFNMQALMNCLGFGLFTQKKVIELSNGGYTLASFYGPSGRADFTKENNPFGAGEFIQSRFYDEKAPKGFVLSDGKGALYLIFRGSTTMPTGMPDSPDWYSNADCQMSTVSLGGDNFLIHKGFFSILDASMENLKGAIGLVKNPSSAFQRIIVSGHSQGGGLSTVMSVLLAKNYKNVMNAVVESSAAPLDIFNFAISSPRVFSKENKESIGSIKNLHITRIHVNKDPVTMVSFAEGDDLKTLIDKIGKIDLSTGTNSDQLKDMTQLFDKMAYKEPIYGLIFGALCLARQFNSTAKMMEDSSVMSWAGWWNGVDITGMAKSMRQLLNGGLYAIDANIKDLTKAKEQQSTAAYLKSFLYAKDINVELLDATQKDLVSTGLYDHVGNNIDLTMSDVSKNIYQRDVFDMFYQALPAEGKSATVFGFILEAIKNMNFGEKNNDINFHDVCETLFEKLSVLGGFFHLGYKSPVNGDFSFSVETLFGVGDGLSDNIVINKEKKVNASMLINNIKSLNSVLKEVKANIVAMEEQASSNAKYSEFMSTAPTIAKRASVTLGYIDMYCGKLVKVLDDIHEKIGKGDDNKVSPSNVMRLFSDKYTELYKGAHGDDYVDVNKRLEFTGVFLTQLARLLFNMSFLNKDNEKNSAFLNTYFENLDKDLKVFNDAFVYAVDKAKESLLKGEAEEE